MEQEDRYRNHACRQYGTRGLKAALEELEYVNGAPGTELADRRVRNGITEPMDIKMWCIGNEMDGPWQVGHMSLTSMPQPWTESHTP